jgi:hypothetical protein
MLAGGVAGSFVQYSFELHPFRIGCEHAQLSLCNWLKQCFGPMLLNKTLKEEKQPTTSLTNIATHHHDTSGNEQPHHKQQPAAPAASLHRPAHNVWRQQCKQGVAECLKVCDVAAAEPC